METTLKKVLIAIAVLVILAIGGGVFFVISNLDSLVKNAIETYGSRATGTPVRVADVSVSLTEGTASIGGLTVGNPEGFSTPNAFELGEITVQIDVAATGADQVTLPRINVGGPAIFYELKQDGTDNLRQLRDNLGTDASEPPPQDEAGAPPRISIGEFTLSDAALSANVIPLDRQYNVTLSGFTLRDLDGTPTEIARQITRQFIQQATDRVRQEGMDALEDRAREKLDEKVDELKQDAADKLKERLGL